MAKMQRACLLALAFCLISVPFCRADEEADLETGEFQKLVAALVAEEGNPPFVATALLDGAKQVPPLNTSASAGFAIAIGSNSSAWVLMVEDVDKMIMAHIHWGNSTTNGPPIVLLGPNGPDADLATLTLPTYSPPLSGKIIMANTFTAADIVVPDTTLTLEGLKEAIADGNIYVNVHTVKYPPGEIRGQVELLDQ